MLRFISSSSRTVLLSYSSASNRHLSRLTRTLSSQTKIIETRSSDEKKTARRVQGGNVRQVNLRKIFSDEETDETSTAKVNDRLNLEPKDSRSIEKSSRKWNQRQETSNDNENLAEEKHSVEETSYSNKISRSNKSEKQKSNENRNLSKLDDSNFVSDRSKQKDSSKNSKTNVDNNFQSEKPKQPRKEGTSNLGKDQSSTSTDISPDRTVSNQKLIKEIDQTNRIEELLKILDQYIVPTEFALGLQKLCQMASQENSEAIHIYQNSENHRQRVESLLLGFSNKFSDHELSTSISFVSTFYQEDNEFTDKFSSNLNNRLRRISIHQLVKILEEIKVSRYTAQWVQRIHNRLLSLAEGRYFEFNNIRDILTLTYKLSYNDRLISRFDERILEISDTLTFDDWFKVLINKSMLKRRDRTVIRAACYHLLKLSDSSLFPLDKIKDCLLACAMLNVYDKSFLERLARDAFEQVHHLKDPFMFQSVVTSLGTLRLRHCELLDALGQRLIEDSQSFGQLKSKCVQTFIKTCAAVNYSPGSLGNLISKHLSLDEQTSEDSNPMTHLKNRIDLVWSLTILDRADAEHLNTVLNQDVFQQIQHEVTNARIASALKLLSIYSYSNQKFSRKLLKPNFNIEQLAQQLTMKNVNIVEQIMKTINAFAAENKFSKFSVVTSNMIVIDCLLIVDKMGVPQDLTTILTNNDNPTTNNSQTTFNRVRLDENRYKIALKFLDYQDQTLLTHSITGSAALQIRLLNGLGYKCVPIYYDEFIKIQVPNDRINFVQRKVKEAISSKENQ